MKRNKFRSTQIELRHPDRLRLIAFGMTAEFEGDEFQESDVVALSP